MTDASNEQAMPEFAVYTNAEDKRPLQTLIWGFHEGVKQNRIGIMSAFDTEQNKEVPILVGLERMGDSVECFPLALVLDDEAAAKFLSPDGEGGWNKPEDVSTH